MRNHIIRTIWRLQDRIGVNGMRRVLYIALWHLWRSLMTESMWWEEI